MSVVTGGSRGIGAAICRRLGQEGHTVHVVCRESQELATQVAREVDALGGHGVAHRADVSLPEDVERLADEVLAHSGTVHVLVNNAGISGDGLVMAMSPTDWEHVLRVNLFGPYHLIRCLLPVMLDQGWGRIINISSNSVRTPGPGQSAYAASKGGLEALTRALAAEIGHKGITVNTVAPGTVRTDMTEPFGHLLDAAQPRMRWGEPEDVGGVVAFLAGDEAGYVQGVTLTVDGGRLVTRQPPARPARPS